MRIILARIFAKRRCAKDAKYIPGPVVPIIRPMKVTSQMWVLSVSPTQKIWTKMQPEQQKSNCFIRLSDQRKVFSQKSCATNRWTWRISKIWLIEAEQLMAFRISKKSSILYVNLLLFQNVTGKTSTCILRSVLHHFWRNWEREQVEQETTKAYSKMKQK